jgi:hypothetical protein
VLVPVRLRACTLRALESGPTHPRDQHVGTSRRMPVTSAPARSHARRHVQSRSRSRPRPRPRARRARRRVTWSRAPLPPAPFLDARSPPHPVAPAHSSPSCARSLVARWGLGGRCSSHPRTRGCVLATARDSARARAGSRPRRQARRARRLATGPRAQLTHDWTHAPRCTQGCALDSGSRVRCCA